MLKILKETQKKCGLKIAFLRISLYVFFEQKILAEHSEPRGSSDKMGAKTVWKMKKVEREQAFRDH